MDYRQPVQTLIPGAQGRILASLAAIENDLTMRQLAEVSGVAVSRVSHVVAHLSAMGIVERRAAGRSALIRLSPDNEAARIVRDLSALRDRVIDRLRTLAHSIEPAPPSLVLFGSFARREAGPDSDIDVAAVRPRMPARDADRWTTSLARWAEASGRISGNPVAILELDEDEVASAISRRSLWREIAEEGTVLSGLSLRDLADA